MAHCNTILSQILKLVLRHKFETLAKQQCSGGAVRTVSRWSQFVSLTMAQLSGRNSLRDIVDNMSVKCIASTTWAAPNCRASMKTNLIPCIKRYLESC